MGGASVNTSWWSSFSSTIGPILVLSKTSLGFSILIISSIFAQSKNQAQNWMLLIYGCILCVTCSFYITEMAAEIGSNCYYEVANHYSGYTCKLISMIFNVLFNIGIVIFYIEVSGSLMSNTILILPEHDQTHSIGSSSDILIRSIMYILGFLTCITSQNFDIAKWLSLAGLLMISVVPAVYLYIIAAGQLPVDDGVSFSAEFKNVTTSLIPKGDEELKSKLKNFAGFLSSLIFIFGNQFNAAYLMTGPLRQSRINRAITVICAGLTVLIFNVGMIFIVKKIFGEYLVLCDAHGKHIYPTALDVPFSVDHRFYRMIINVALSIMTIGTLPLIIISITPPTDHILYIFEEIVMVIFRHLWMVFHRHFPPIREQQRGQQSSVVAMCIGESISPVIDINEIDEANVDEESSVVGDKKTTQSQNQIDGNSVPSVQVPEPVEAVGSYENVEDQPIFCRRIRKTYITSLAYTVGLLPAIVCPDRALNFLQIFSSLAGGPIALIIPAYLYVKHVWRSSNETNIQSNILSTKIFKVLESAVAIAIIMQGIFFTGFCGVFEISAVFPKIIGSN